MKKSKKAISIEEALKNHNSSKNQSIKRKFVGAHVYCNVGTLAEYIINKGLEDSGAPFTLDDIENYYSYPEYRGTYANFDGGTQEQRQEEIDRLQELADNESNLEINEAILREIEELEDLEQEPTEIYEWWAVSDYLFDKLKSHGYCVVDAGSCYIWGRSTTGQAILLDHVIGIICAEMEILEGQENEWSV